MRRERNGNESEMKRKMPSFDTGVRYSLQGLDDRRKLMKKLTFVLLLAVALEAWGETRTVATTAKRPKLVVAIIADQFRYDYLLRFRGAYKEGIDQLLRKGATFTNARYEHFPTFTAVGHSTFLSGAYPSVSGIVSNMLYDRASRKMIGVAHDETARQIGGGGGPGASPRTLQVSTLGDEMKSADPGAKVVGISLKDYSGIMATGHMADAVYWFDNQTGDFVTSSYYVDDLPGWAKSFNAARPADRFRGMVWQGKRLPAEAGPNLYRMLWNASFGSELMEQMAEAAVDGEQMGRDDVPDLLMLSFSANDSVGHGHGPDSPEVREISIATDRVLGKLFRFLDARVGMANVTVVFAADHGVAPAPEVSVKRRMPGGRLEYSVVGDAVKKTLVAKYGEGDWVAPTTGEVVYLNWDLISSKKLALEEVTDEAARAARAVAHVSRVYTRTQLMNGLATADMVGRRVMNGFSPTRGADLYVITDPYFIFGQGTATHGSPFGYDTHVPLIFMGPGIKAGAFHGSVAINDVAPTLATILGVEIPSGSEGRILSEMISGK